MLRLEAHRQRRRATLEPHCSDAGDAYERLASLPVNVRLDMVRLASGRKLSTSLRPYTPPRFPASFRASPVVPTSSLPYHLPPGPIPIRIQISHRRDIQDITGRGEICIIRIAGQPTHARPFRCRVPTILRFSIGRDRWNAKGCSLPKMARILSYPPSLLAVHLLARCSSLPKIYQF